MMNNLTAQQRIERAHVAIMSHKLTSAYAGIVMMAKATVVDGLPTARTNGLSIEYGREYVDSCDDPTLNATVLHELGHIIYQHLWLWSELWKENPQLANMAADYIVNADIKEYERKDPAFVRVGDDWCYDPKYQGWDTLSVYRDLKQQGGNGGGGGSGKQMDEHDWEDAERLSQQDVEAIRIQIDNAIRQGAIAAGKIGNDTPRSFEELMEAKVDWREQLREFVQTTCAGKDESTWRRPNKRYMPLGIYLPSTYSEAVEELVIGVDTSGSVGGKELQEFMSEVVGLCTQVLPSKAHLIYWDSDVAAHEVYGVADYDSLATTTKPKGGGGTRAACVADYLTQNSIKPQAVIMLTDGYNSSWGNWTCPVLWVIVGGNTVVPPVGLTIRIR